MQTIVEGRREPSRDCGSGIQNAEAGKFSGHMNSENHLSPVENAWFQAVIAAESITVNGLSVAHQ